MKNKLFLPLFSLSFIIRGLLFYGNSRRRDSVVA
jgi:hypothetical protein